MALPMSTERDDLIAELEAAMPPAFDYINDAETGEQIKVPVTPERRAEMIAATADHQLAERQKNSRQSARDALAAQWMDPSVIPRWISVPYQDRFDRASSYLDDGDDEGAALVIEHAAPSRTFSEDQIAMFNAIKSTMAAAIAALPK